jgi:hypothetical protein
MWPSSQRQYFIFVAQYSENQLMAMLCALARTTGASCMSQNMLLEDMIENTFQ